MTMSFAAQINSVMAALILLTAFGLLVQRRILGLIHLFAWQGFFLCSQHGHRRLCDRGAPPLHLVDPDPDPQGHRCSPTSSTP